MDNVNVRVELGLFNVLVDTLSLEVGTVVKVKCTIEEWKGMKQLELKRIKLVRSTAEEIREWEEVARWKTEILDTPWVLEKERLEEMDRKDTEDREKQLAEQRKAEDKKMAHLVKRRAREAKRKSHEEKWERRRRKEEVMMNASALI